MAPVSKRPAAVAMGGLRKKPAVDPVLQKCSEVTAALQAAGDSPASVRAMLSFVAPPSLATIKEARHPYQTAVVDMVDEALKAIEAGLEKEVSEANAKVDGCPADKVARAAALTKAQDNIVILKEAITTAKAKHDEDKTALSQADDALALAKKTQKADDACLEAAAAKKGRLEKVSQDALKAAKEHAEPPLVRMLLKLGKELALDSSLLNTISIALKKEPAERGSFDTLAIEQFEGAVTKAISELAVILEEGQPGKAERAASVEAAQAAKSEAADKLLASIAALDEATAAQKAGAAEVKAAQKAADRFFADAQVVMDTYDELKAKLAALRAGPLVAFGSLKELVAPPPEPEEPAAPEGEPAELAAPEPAAPEPAASEVAVEAGAA